METGQPAEQAAETISTGTGPSGLVVEDRGETLRAAAEAGATEGERRPVTVLFADLAGFTPLSERLDPEDLAALVDRCLRSMSDAIYRYEGTVDKYIGDCVMALFGAPVAHEDDPERAVRTALDMVDRIARISVEVGSARRADGDPPLLSLRVGVNTGMVVAGAVGADRRREYTVLGDAVNVAARLQTAAAENQVVVGEPTYRLARHVAAFEPLGEVALKGKSEPLSAYRVLGLLPEPRSPRGLETHALAAPLIGRDDELEQLFAAFDRALRGGAQVVSLIGEAGAGKTRLQREFFSRLEDEGRLAAAGVAVRRAACSSLGEEVYGVLAALLRDAYGLSPREPEDVAKAKIARGLAAVGQDADEIARSAPLVGHVLGIDYGDPRLRYIEPEQLKRQLFLIVRDLLERRLRQGPFVLVVEDLHWADAASVELLRFLVDRLGDRPVMLLLTHRPSFEGGQVVSARATFTAIRLAPLPERQSAALLDAMFGPSAERLPVRLRELIVSRAGGSPFYLEEVVRSLVDTGVLVRDEHGWTCTADVDTLDVPPTVQGVLLARLDNLPRAPRRLVQEAAVLGTEFGIALLRAVCSDSEAADIHLDLLHQSEFVEELPRSPDVHAAGERRYRFVHNLVQEVAYQSLLVRRRAELHGRAGEALQEIWGIRAGAPLAARRHEELEALGHHFGLSAHKLEGARYLTAAGDGARAIYANEDAARLYRRALDTLAARDPVESDAQRLALSERLGDVLGPTGRRNEAVKHYEAVLAAHEERDDRPAQARLHRKIGALHWAAGDRARAVTHYEAGLAALDRQPEHIELAHLHQEMGRLAFRTGENERAVEWSRRALDLGQRLLAAGELSDDRREAAEAIAQANNTLGVALARMGQFEEAVQHVERCVAVAREQDVPQVACRAYSNLGVLYSTLDPGRAIETCIAGLELAKKIGDLGLQPWLYANLAGAYCTFTGQCEDEGIAAAQAAIELDRQLGQMDHLAVPLIVLGQIYQCHGQPGSALQCYEEARNLAEEMQEPQLLFPCYDGLATLHLEMGDEAQAELYMLKSQQVCEQAGLDVDSLVVLPFLG